MFYTNLHNCAAAGGLKWVKEAIVKGIDVNSTKDGSTALHKAAANGHEEIVQYLLSWKADQTITDNNDNTALEKAVEGKHQKIVVMLSTTD